MEIEKNLSISLFAYKKNDLAGLMKGFFDLIHGSISKLRF